MGIRLEVQGHIATVTLDRPEKLNALDSAMRSQLTDAWCEVRNNPDIWVAILTGTGTRAFSAGIDLKEYGRSATGDGGSELWTNSFWVQDGSGFLETDLNIRKPILAAIEGHCLGAGLTLALASDLRIAATTARFAYPEAKWGVSTVAGALRLPRIVSLGLAFEMLLAGDAIDAERAYQSGLVNRLVPEGQALPEAMALAERLCQNAPLAVQATKETILRGLTLPFNDAWRLGEGLRRAVQDTEDFREGMLSFRDKRPPEYRGK